MRFHFMRKTNWKIAIVFSAFLPVFNIINNSQYTVITSFKRIFLGWCVTFIFLLTSWYVNSLLTVFFENTKRKIDLFRKILIVFCCNAVFLMIFIWLGIYILKDIGGFFLRKDYLYLYIFLKGLLSIGIIYIIQFAINTDAKAQDITLQNQILKTENIKAQFELLRQQVNPHFLFNSLSTLRSMIRSNSEKSEVFVVKLSEIYRQLLLKREKELVSLKEEFEFINDYLFMLDARFEAMLKVNIDVPENFMNLKIPTFSLQLLLENCIKHNIISKDKPLTIKIFYTNPESIIIENNLQPKLTKEEPSGFGLQNLEKRYRLLGMPEGIHIFSDASVFRVKIKLLNI